MDRRPLPVVAAVVVALAYGWWAAGLRPFTWPALAAVAGAGVAAIAVGTRLPPRPRPGGDTGDARGGVAVWAVLAALVAGWELAAWLQQPRADHPTLSALADQVLDWRPARALAFSAWLALGAELARR